LKIRKIAQLVETSELETPLSPKKKHETSPSFSSTFFSIDWSIIWDHPRKILGSENSAHCSSYCFRRSTHHEESSTDFNGVILRRCFSTRSWLFPADSYKSCFGKKRLWKESRIVYTIRPNLEVRTYSESFKGRICTESLEKPKKLENAQGVMYHRGRVSH
jgi:hypothetical protein